nr:enoyl-CoA hydratase/isomerase family protein [Kibdelosporangium sp. MJ126-NF4]CEL19906.1 Enoyl-CoA hydratase [Kibdelosporangium sp. MJ126-NF4]CTQ97130.1 Enoyl-CoA hydratase (EC 4.2.1.17) [Kibdelosporangium sp. MJ126-NF4]
MAPKDTESSTVDLSSPAPHVAVITLTSPPRNVLSKADQSRMRKTLTYLDDDPWVRAVVITGGGNFFTAGADPTEDEAVQPGQLRNFLSDFDTLLDSIERFRTPVIAAVNGPAEGGGFELALACDIRVASTTAYFDAAGVNIGLVAHFWRLARITGVGKAKDILLTGDRCSVEQALRWGLVTRAYAPEKLRSEALSLAQRIAGNAPLSVEATKRCTGVALDVDRAKATRLRAAEFATLFQTLDHKEALRAAATRTPGKYHRH